MTNTTQYIVACIDGSELGDVVSAYAIWLAQNSQIPIKFLHTIEHSHRGDNAHHQGTLTPNIKEHLLNELSDQERIASKQLIADGKTILNKAQQMAQQAGLTNIVAKQRHGTLPEALADLQAEISMVVLGVQGEDHAGNKKELGSQLEDAIRAVHAPLFIVKNSQFIKPNKLMFAYNGSPTATKALYFIKQALFCKQLAELHIVVVHNDLAEAQQLVTQAEAELSATNTTVRSKAIAGQALDELIHYQQQHQIDTTAMGAFSHGKVRGLFFGSFTTDMLLEADTNFLLIR